MSAAAKPASHMVRGVSLELGGTVVLRLLSMARLVVFARLFVPEEYGAYTTGLIVVSLALLLVGGSLQAFVVKAGDQGLATTFWTAFVLAAGFGGILALVVAVSGIPLAIALDDPLLRVTLAILSLSVLEAALTLPLTLLDRRLRFGLAKAIEAVGVVGGVATTVALDLAGTTPVYAMASGHVAAIVLRSSILWLAVRPLPAFSFSLEEARRQVRFAAPLTGAGAFAFVEGRGDDLGVRVLWGNEALGLYSVAFYAPALLREVVVAIDRVTLPIFARLSGRELADAFTTATRLLAVVSVPAGFGLAAFSTPLTVLALGERWVGAAHLMTLIGVAFGVKGCLGLNWGALAYVSNATGTVARVAVVNAVLMVGVGVPLIAWLGPVGGAWYALADALVFGPIQRFPFIRRVLGDLGFLAASVRPIAVAGALAIAAALLGSQELGPWQGLAGFLSLFAVTVSVAVAWDRELRRVLAEAVGMG